MGSEGPKLAQAKGCVTTLYHSSYKNESYHFFMAIFNCRYNVASLRHTFTTWSDTHSPSP